MSNAVLLRGEDAAAYGVDFDGNDAMRGRRLGCWLTDRSSPDGSWKEGTDPESLLAEGVTPILCLTHPNNWVSGLSLWLDRLRAALLPSLRAGQRVRIVRTRGDAPPRSLDSPASIARMESNPEAGSWSVEPAEADFAAIADSLREAVIDFYAVRGQTLEGSAGSNTLETNSGYVARRTEPLLEFIRRHSAHDSFAGLRVADLGCGFGAMSIYLAARGARVTGLDPNGQRFEVGRAVAAKHGLEIDFVAGRMEHMPLPDEAFDLAVQNNSLCYLVDHDQRHAALEETHRILRPGGTLISRNPNRWHPLDQFTALPLLHLLPPTAAVAAARRAGRERSLVRLTSPLSARRELRRAGFVGVVQAGFPGGERPAALKWWARYHHVVASRPER